MPPAVPRTRWAASPAAAAAALALAAVALIGAPRGARAHSFPVSYSTISVEEHALTWRLTIPVDAALCVMDTPGFSRDELIVLGPGIIPPLPSDLETRLQDGIPLVADYLRSTLHVLNGEAAADPIVEGFVMAGNAIVYTIRYAWVDRPFDALAIRSSLLLDLDASYVNIATAQRADRTAQAVLSESAREWRLDARTLAEVAAPREGGGHAPSGGVLGFIRLGSVHILGDLPDLAAAALGRRGADTPPLGWNYDHLLFVLGLLVAVESLSSLIKVVTAFTVAHTLTLALASSGVVSISQQVADIAVAMTLVYVGVENLRARPPRRRPLVAFALGLVHGFAFAEVLSGARMSALALAGCLLGFNLGVEICQIGIVLAVYPVLALARRDAPAAPGSGRARALAIRRTGSAFVAIAGAVWLVERVAAVVAR
jgi:hypothetical protein